MIEGRINYPIPLSMTLEEGDTNLYPLIRLFNTSIYQKTINLIHISGGFYSGDWTPTSNGYYQTLGIVYTDYEYSVTSNTYGRIGETIWIDGLESEISSQILSLSSQINWISSNAVDSLSLAGSSQVSHIMDETNFVSSQVRDSYSINLSISSQLFNISSQLSFVSSNICPISGNIRWVSSQLIWMSSQTPIIHDDIDYISSQVNNLSSDILSISSQLYNVSSQMAMVSSNILWISSSSYNISTQIRGLSSQTKGIESYGDNYWASSQLSQVWNQTTRTLTDDTPVVDWISTQTYGLSSQIKGTQELDASSVWNYGNRTLTSDVGISEWASSQIISLSSQVNQLVKDINFVSSQSYWISSNAVDANTLAGSSQAVHLMAESNYISSQILSSSQIADAVWGSDTQEFSTAGTFGDTLGRTETQYRNISYDEDTIMLLVYVGQTGVELSDFNYWFFNATDNVVYEPITDYTIQLSEVDSVNAPGLYKVYISLLADKAPGSLVHIRLQSDEFLDPGYHWEFEMASGSIATLINRVGIPNKTYNQGTLYHELLDSKRIISAGASLLVIPQLDYKINDNIEFQYIPYAVAATGILGFSRWSIISGTTYLASGELFDGSINDEHRKVYYKRFIHSGSWGIGNFKILAWFDSDSENSLRAAEYKVITSEDISFSSIIPELDYISSQVAYISSNVESSGGGGGTPKSYIAYTSKQGPWKFKEKEKILKDVTEMKDLLDKLVKDSEDNHKDEISMIEKLSKEIDSKINHVSTFIKKASDESISDSNKKLLSRMDDNVNLIRMYKTQLDENKSSDITVLKSDLELLAKMVSTLLADEDLESIVNNIGK